MKKKSPSANQKSGRAIDHYDNGKTRYSGTLKGGKPHGKWKFYRKDGSLMRSGEFNLGEQSGVWKTFDRTGELVKETDFSPKIKK